jgi:hypothetical protein
VKRTVRARTRARRTFATGASTVEFLLVAMLALIPLALGTMELALLVVAKHVVSHGTFLAARAGALHHGDRSTMQRYLAKGLAPLYLRTGAAEAGDLAARAGAAYLRALGEVLRPDLTRVEILNPTRESFADFERWQGGVRQIPNDSLRHRRESGARSGQTIQESNLLSLRVRYCRRLIFPFVDRAITATLSRLDFDPFAQSCYAQRRVPIEGRALVHMHSAARRSLMGL